MICHEAAELALHFQICSKPIQPLIRRADFLVLGPTWPMYVGKVTPGGMCSWKRCRKKTSWLLCSVSFPKQFKWLVLGFFDYIVHENNVQCLASFCVLLRLLVCFFRVLSDVSDGARILQSTLRLWRSGWEASESGGLPMSPVTFRFFAVSYFVGLFMEKGCWKAMAFVLAVSASTGQRENIFVWLQ